MKYSQCCFGLRFSFTPTPTASSLAVGTTLLYLLIFVTCISFKCQELNNAKILQGSNFEVILTFLEWCNLLFLFSISRERYPDTTPSTNLNHN